MEKEEKNILMNIFNQCKEVPEGAKKKITGGRLTGMTDIKPMWRIQKLTEMFGPCGFGWKTIIKNKEIIEGANEEKIAVVDIDLYIKVDGKWSEAIEGTGGSSFIAKEQKGLYTSDECFKMAYTDALSVACKSIGMGADVYWGDSKYDTGEEITLEVAKDYVLDFGKHKGKKLNELDKGYLYWLYENNEKCKTMIELLGLIELDDNNIEEQTNIIQEIQRLVDTAGLDLEIIKGKYNLKTLNDASISQLIDIKTTLNNLINKGE